MGSCRFPSGSAARSTAQDLSRERTPNRSQFLPSGYLFHCPFGEASLLALRCPEGSSAPGFDQLALGGQHSFTRRFRQTGVLDMFGEAEQLERPDAVPIHVYFVPLQTVAGRGGIGVMIVVPALAEGEQGDYPVVSGRVPRGKTT